MSWLARSIANSLKLDDEEDDRNRDKTDDYGNSSDKSIVHDSTDDSPASPTSPSRGVKEDLSELTKTLTRQFWGVASFLAPPPQSPPPSQASESDHPRQPFGPDPDPEVISGIRNDFAEIGGRFRSGISKLSSNIAVTEITKMASNLLQLGPDGDDFDSARGAVGVTEEVVVFARDISMHPETWLDFPLHDDEDDEEFDMTDAQQEHALAVEHLAPGLAALRMELCPGYMSEACFWMIYFVLLHPRLSRNDALLLSTPQILKARALLTNDLKNRGKAKSGQELYGTGSKDTVTSHSEASLSALTESPKPTTSEADIATEKHLVLMTDIPIVDKSVIEEWPSKHKKDDDDDGDDDWLKEEESSEMIGGTTTTTSAVATTTTTIPIDDEDVSFSDLEEDDGDAPMSYKKVTYCSDSSTKDSRDWVQLGRSSTDSVRDNNSGTADRAGHDQTSAYNSDAKESNDWLSLDDIDVA